MEGVKKHPQGVPQFTIKTSVHLPPLISVWSDLHVEDREAEKVLDSLIPPNEMQIESFQLY